jgi:hypothetical protein
MKLKIILKIKNISNLIQIKNYIKLIRNNIKKFKIKL